MHRLEERLGARLFDRRVGLAGAALLAGAASAQDVPARDAAADTAADLGVDAVVPADDPVVLAFALVTVIGLASVLVQTAAITT